MLTLLGMTKEIKEWAVDPRCPVSLNTIRRRLRNGWPHTEAVLTPNYEGRLAKKRGPLRKLFTAWGEAKTAEEWSKDSRGKVSAKLIRARISTGFTPEEAVSLPKSVRRPSKKRKMVNAWGETKTIPEWARDSRARVTADVIRSRIRNGYSGEDAMSLPKSARRPQRENKQKRR
jgi:hypothetical protein